VISKTYEVSENLIGLKNDKLFIYITKMTEKLIILDLDETLIHATKERLGIEEDFMFDKYFVYKRPFLEQFLLELSADFKIGIWSSADDEYVADIANQIKPPLLCFL